MVPAVFGAAVYQISNLVDALLASLLPEGSVSYLYYADRLVQFPLGIFAIAMATAILPSLSRQASNDDMIGLKNTFGHSMKLIFFITLPAMIGLIVLREPIVALLFRRGAFDAESTRLTAYALLFYGVGLWAFSAVRIVFSTFYAMQDTRTPVVMAAISLVAKVGLSIILMQYLAHGGLALATSLASMLNFGLLIWALRKRLGPLGFQSVFRSVAMSAVCALIMGLVVWYVGSMVIPEGSSGLMGLFFGLFGCILAGILVYIGLSYLFKSPELGAVMEIAGKRGRD
jgi:putative peptidoglycan lipid II flippase